MMKFIEKGVAMAKRAFIVALFVTFFAVLLWWLFVMKRADAPQMEQPEKITEVRQISDSLHSYNAADISSACSAEDKIFCAIELAVKCTLVPELDGCSTDVVPGFVLGQVDNEVRPRQLSFEITKIKPLPESTDIAVYTKSDCDASWFGLCKGTVIYSLSQLGDGWRVVNIYALEQ